MDFKNPYCFLLLLALLPYIVWYLLRFKKSQPVMRMPEVAKYRYVPRSLRSRLLHLPFLLRILTLVLLIIVLARPQSKYTFKDTDVEGIDIMLAVDVSTSMLAQDFQPNRVEALKEIAKEFIESRPNDNIGLTFFAGEAYTQCPLTTDHAMLIDFYEKADMQMAAKGVLEDGTAIGDGINNALLRLRDSQAKSKVIILLTDGVSNTGHISPMTAAEIAKEQGVRVYTIGIGKNGMAPYPMPTGVVMPIEVRIDEPMMRKISEETGGKYFRARKNAELSAIYNDINQLERTKFNVQQFTRRTELYHPFALAALITFLLELLVRIFVLRRLP